MSATEFCFLCIGFMLGATVFTVLLAKWPITPAIEPLDSRIEVFENEDGLMDARWVNPENAPTSADNL